MMTFKYYLRTFVENFSELLIYSFLYLFFLDIVYKKYAKEVMVHSTPKMNLIGFIIAILVWTIIIYLLLKSKINVEKLFEIFIFFSGWITLDLIINNSIISFVLILFLYYTYVRMEKPRGFLKYILIYSSFGISLILSNSLFYPDNILNILILIAIIDILLVFSRYTVTVVRETKYILLIELGRSRDKSVMMGIGDLILSFSLSTYFYNYYSVGCAIISIIVGMLLLSFIPVLIERFKIKYVPATPLFLFIQYYSGIFFHKFFL